MYTSVQDPALSDTGGSFYTGVDEWIQWNGNSGMVE